MEILTIMAAIIVYIAGIAASEIDSAYMAIATFVLLFVFLYTVLEVPVFALIVANPLISVGIVTCYLVIGTLYTRFWKWPKFIKKNRNTIKKHYDDWVSDQDDDKDKSFNAFLNSQNYIFHANNHFERILAWILVWPVSFSLELFRNPIVWLFRNVCRNVGGFLESASRNTARMQFLKDTKED